MTDYEYTNAAYTCRETCKVQNAVRGTLITLLASWMINNYHRDNLEFLQWMKRFWDANYGGQGYDAVARRKGAPAEAPATVAALPSTRTGLGVGGARTGGRTPVGGHRSASVQPEVVLQLQKQVEELSAHLEGLEKERDFYFAKVNVQPSYIGILCLSPAHLAARY